MHKNKIIPRDPPVIQPEKCRRCIWGKWQDTTQYCSFANCIKDTGRPFTADEAKIYSDVLERRFEAEEKVF
jgi:hypothetical protein